MKVNNLNIELNKRELLSEIEGFITDPDLINKSKKKIFFKNMSL